MSAPRRVGRNWWREFVVETWRGADAAWRAERDAECIGYATEEAEYGSWGESSDTPARPTLKGTMIQCAGLRDNLMGVAS